MCGIVGFQGDFPAELLQRMSAAVAHRGPDGAGALVLTAPNQPPTGLAHRRLAIIDLSEAGRQPMTVAPDVGGAMQSGLTLTYNGEIYNYRELRGELAADGHRFVSASDSEVLLHLYEKHGLAMLDRLNGIFAFAIHDARPAGRPEGVPQGALFVARDQFGVKPLYYTQVERGFLFASEIKALLQERSVSRDIDASALHYMLAYLWTPSPQTILASVKKLEPGAALLAHGGKILRTWTYYDVPYNGTRSCAPEPELAHELADRVRTAVWRQLVSDVPVGAYLSGGLDSSAIVAMMRKALPDQVLKCYCVSFPEGENVDGSPADLPYARRVAKHLAVDLEEVIVEPTAITRLEEMIELLDEPQADPAPINSLLIAERARAQGIPVLLSGAGGDDLFTGYRRHRALAFERRWAWLPKPLRSGIQHAVSGLNTGKADSRVDALRRRGAKMFAYAGEESERRLASYFWWSTEDLRRGLYSPEFAARLAGVHTAAPMLRSLARIPRESDPLQRMLYLEMRHFLADHNLNYTDRSGMAVGVEIRVPLLDRELVEFATTVPSAMKQRGSIGKAIFKRAMEPYLPRDIIYRSKSGFGAPLRRWLRFELRDQVDATLDPVLLRRRGYFDPVAVQRLVHMDRSGMIDGSYTVFALMCFELWCKRFLDR